MPQQYFAPPPAVPDFVFKRESGADAYVYLKMFREDDGWYVDVVRITDARGHDLLLSSEEDDEVFEMAKDHLHQKRTQRL